MKGNEQVWSELAQEEKDQAESNYLDNSRKAKSSF